MGSPSPRLTPRLAQLTPLPSARESARPHSGERSTHSNASSTAPNLASLPPLPGRVDRGVAGGGLGVGESDRTVSDSDTQSQGATPQQQLAPSDGLSALKGIPPGAGSLASERGGKIRAGGGDGGDITEDGERAERSSGQGGAEPVRFADGDRGRDPSQEAEQTSREAGPAQPVHGLPSATVADGDIQRRPGESKEEFATRRRALEYEATALFLLKLDSPVRLFFIRAVEWEWWDRVVLLLIFLNRCMCGWVRGRVGVRVRVRVCVFVCLCACVTHACDMIGLCSRSPCSTACS